MVGGVLLQYNQIPYVPVCAKLLQSCPTPVILWTIACQAPLSIGFSRQEYWSGLPCLPPEDLPKPGTEPTPLMSPAMTNFFTTSATWLENYIAVVLPQEWEFWAPGHSPQPGGLKPRLGAPRAFNLEGQQAPSTRAPQDWGRDPALEGHTQDFTCTRKPGQTVTPEQPGPGPPTGLGGFAGEAEVGRGSPRTKGHWWQRTQGTPSCVSSPRGHRFGTESWPHSTGHRFQCWHAAGQTTNSENTVPPMSRQAAQSLLSQRPPINTLFDMVLPTVG